MKPEPIFTPNASYQGEPVMVYQYDDDGDAWFIREGYSSDFCHPDSLGPLPKIATSFVCVYKTGDNTFGITSFLGEEAAQDWTSSGPQRQYYGPIEVDMNKFGGEDAS